MKLLKRFLTCSLAAGAIALMGGLAGCSLSAHVHDPGGPYYDGGYVYTPAPGYYQPYYYYTEPSVGVYYYDGDGHRHNGHYRDREAREWRERHRR
jgi:hypothetical protein